MTTEDKNEWFDQQHCWYAYQWNNEQLELYFRLDRWCHDGSAVHACGRCTTIEPHANHGCDQVSVVRSLYIILYCPLEYNQEAHPSKHSIDEDDLRDEFEEEIDPVLHLQSVESFQDYTEYHLRHTQDDS